MKENTTAPKSKKQRVSSLLKVNFGFSQIIGALDKDHVFDKFTNSEEKKNRNRVFTPKVTVGLWALQCLSSDKSLKNSVAYLNNVRTQSGLKAVSSDPASYCEARQKISCEMLSTLATECGTEVSQKSSQSFSWKNRKIKATDGSTFTMMDSKENQKAFPQHGAQEEGAGHPIARFLTLMCLATGAILAAAIAPFQGKGTGEHSLLREIFKFLEKGDILVADAYYGSSYLLLAMLQFHGIDAVFRLGSPRKVDFRKGKKNGQKDHTVSWSKPKKPDWMTQEIYDELPNQISVRELRFYVDMPGFRTRTVTVVTTLTDSKDFSVADLKGIYHRRWLIELGYRDLKSTMDMDQINCKSPEMVKKDFWSHILAYNLIRKLSLKAALPIGIKPIKLSFKGIIQLLNNFKSFVGTEVDLDKHINDFMALVSQQLVKERPGRSEPRAIKKRKKSYPLLTKHRASYKKQGVKPMAA